MAIFTGLLDGEVQQGPGLQIYPTTNTPLQHRIFVNPSDQTFSRPWGYGVSALHHHPSRLGHQYYGLQRADLSGNILTKNLNSRVIHLTLEFYQPERYQQVRIITNWKLRETRITQ